VAQGSIAAAIDRLDKLGTAVQPVFIDMDPERAAFVSIPAYLISASQKARAQLSFERRRDDKGTKTARTTARATRRSPSAPKVARARLSIGICNDP
jgi:cytochrome oxidase Cu insertion factor (SCO1/SenC/PrrC family)